MVNRVNPDAKEGEPGYTTAFVGGVNLVNNAGQVVDTVGYGTEAAKVLHDYQSSYDEDRPKVYNVDGEYKTKMDATMSYDNGKITFNVPDYMANSDWFKKNFTENDNFKSLAAAYKMDPTGATGLTTTDSEGNTVQRKVSDLLEQYSQALGDFSKQYQGVEDLRNSVKQKTGITMDDDTILIYANEITRDKNKFDNNSVVYIPEYIKRQTNFARFGSWDEETGTLSAKDFYEWYNLDDPTDQHKASTISAIMDATARAITDTERMAGGGVVEESPESIREYAKNVALYRTLMADNPDAGFITSAKAFDYSLGISLFDNLFTSIGNVMTVYEDITNVLDNANIDMLDVTSSPAKLTLDYLQAGLTAAGSVIAGEPLQMTTETQQALLTAGLVGMVANTLKADKTGNGIDTITDVYKEVTGKDDKTTFRQVRDEVHNFLLEKHNELTRLSSAATAGSIVGGMTAEILKQMFITNPIGENLGNLVSKAFVAGMNPADVTSGMQILAKSMNAKELDNAVKFGSFTSNIFGQALSDTVLNDADALHIMFTEGDATEAVKAVSMNGAFNLVGELTGLATTDGWKALKRTVPGQAVDAWAARGINKIASSKYKIRGKLAEFMNGFFKSTDTSGKSIEKFNTAFNYEMAEATGNVANARALAREGETVTEATRRLIGERVELEVSFGRVTRNTQRTLLDLQTNPKIRPYLEDAYDAAGKVISLEQAAGVSKGATKLITQETSDYIALSNRLQYYANKTGGKLNIDALPKAQQEYVIGIQKRVAEYENKNPIELSSAAKEYSNKLTTFYYQFNDYLSKEGILDRATLLERRSTGFWGSEGDQWMKTQTLRATDPTQVETAKWLTDDLSRGRMYRVKTEMDDYSYKPGDVDAHYMDPGLTMLSYQSAAAKVIDARRFSNALIRTHTLAKEIDTKGQPITSAEIRKIRKQAYDTTKQTMKDFVSNDDATTYAFANAYKKQENIANRIAKKQQKADKLLGLDDTRYNSIALDLNEDGIALMRERFDIPEYGTVRTTAELNELYYSGSAAQKQAIDQALGTDQLTVRNYNNAINNTDLAERLARTYISENSDIMNSKVFKDYATEVRTQQLTARQQTTLKRYIDEVKALQKEAKMVEMGTDEFTNVIGEFTDDMAKEVSARLKKNKFIQEALKRYTDAGISEKQAMRYLSLYNLKNSLDDAQFTRLIDKNLNNITTSGNLTTKQKTRFAQAIKRATKSNVDSELSDAIRVLEKNGSGAIVDADAVFKEIYDCMEEFAENTVKAPNVVRVMDEAGEFHLYEVSPTTAYLINNRPDYTNIKSGKIVQFFNKTNRLFRTFTTGYSLSSFTNQWMRDPMNSYIMGGFVRGLNANAEEIGRLFGPNIVEAMKRELGEAEWGRLLARSGGDEAELVGRTILEQSNRLYNSAAPETQMYRELANARRETLFGDYEKPVGRMEKAMRTLEEHSLGNSRELYLRKANYTQAYNDALQMGKTTKEAASWAEIVADNATTDFSRTFAWGNNIVNSVPYLGAAINGQASFWRLLEIDPTGVAGRFTLGLVIPTIALTANSTASEENRRVYKNIPEYVKEDNLVFVADGQAFKIPIPQELSVFIAPFRQMVEKANDANDNTWQELILSDILSVPAIDFSGLADLNDPLNQDADFFSRLSNEAETLISQLSPVALKTAYMAATGRDPYTHSNIDSSYTYIDEDGNAQIMDSADSSFARWFSATAKNLGISLSASSAETLLSQFFGQGFMDLDGIITGLFSGNPVSSLEVAGRRATKPFTAVNYNQTESAWRQVVKQLQAEKQALLADPDLAKINNAIGATSDPDKLKNLRAQYRERVQAYRDKVLNAVQQYNNAYGADYDWKKFGSTISLLSFYNNTQDLSTAAAKADASDLYYAAQDTAKQTMVDMGFVSPTDWSIFGYLHTDANGNVEARATTPVQILNMDNTFYRAKDETTATLENVISNVVDVNGKTLKEKYREMTAKETQLYATKDYDALEDLYKKWDVEFMVSIYPTLAQNSLLDQYGNSLLDNNEVIDLLDNYIRVPSSYMGKGKYISSSTGLNKNRGYAKSYIQKLYETIGGK